MSTDDSRAATSTRGRKIGQGLLWAIGYVVFYVALDWISYIQPYGNLDITPWNPPPGLSLAFLLLRGLRWSPLLYVAQVAADAAVRGFAAPLGPTLLADVAVAGGYATAAWLLIRVFRIDPLLRSLKDVLVLVGLQIPTALVVAGSYVAVFHFVGTIPTEDVGQTVLRYWIGDMIGVAIFTPLFLTLGHGMPTRSVQAGSSPWISVLQAASILLALWIVFGGDLTQHPQLYYPLFMPLVWVGAWHGLQGVAVALFATQIGMVVAIEEAQLDAGPLTEIQFFLLALSITSLFLGAIATERRRDRMALADSQAHLQAVVDVTPEGILTLGADGRIDSVNAAFERLSGRSRADLVGQKILSVVPGWADLLPNDGGDMLLTRPDGSVVPVEVSIGRAELSESRLWVALVRDVSRHRLRLVNPSTH